jgi:hypothetical protein
MLLPLFAHAASRDKTPPPVETNRVIHVLDFQVPQYDTNGVMTGMLKGNDANIYPDHMTEIKGVVMDLFKHTVTGKVTDVRVTSPRCFYNPEKGYAVSEDTIRIARDNMVITGSNYVVNAKDQNMKINHDAKVVLIGVQNESLNSHIGRGTNGPPARLKVPK